MKFRIVLAFIALAALLTSLAGCDNTTVEKTDEVTKTTSRTVYRPTVTTVPMIDRDLTTLISADELSDAVGIPMQELTIMEQNSGLCSFSVESNLSSVVIDIKEGTLDLFESRVLQGYLNISTSTVEVCPNLGESAFFAYDPELYNDQLVVYNDGYMITIELAIEGYDDHGINKLRCRDIAAIVLNRL